MANTNSVGDMTTRTAINALLKVMQKDVVEQFDKSYPVLNMIKSDFGKEVAGGRSVEIPLRVRPNTNIAGVRGAAGVWAKGSRGRRETATVDVYPVNTVGQYGHIDELKTKKQLQSLKSVAQAMVEDIQDGFPLSMAKLIWLDGTGILAKVGATAGNNQLDIYLEGDASVDGTWGTKYLDIGMHVHFTDAKTDTVPTILDGDAQVTEINETTGIVGFEGNIAGVAADDFVCLQDMLNNAPVGILAAVCDGTTAPTYGTTYMGIDRTSAANNFWQSNVTDLGGSGTVEDEIVKIQTATAKRTGEMPEVVLTTYEVYNNIWSQAKSSQGRQFIVHVGENDARKYALGFEGATVTTLRGTLEIIPDRFCPAGVAVGLNPKHFKWYTPDTSDSKYGGWYKDSSGNMYHQIPRSFGIEAVWLWVTTLVCSKPAATWRLIDVPELT